MKKDEEKFQKTLFKTFFIFTVAVVVLILFSVFGNVAKNNGTIRKLLLVLDFGTDKQTFQVETSKEARAWSYLQQAAAVAKIDLKPTKDFRPQKIDGYPNGRDNKSWNFYVNGIKQKASPYDVFVRPPASIAFKFE